MAQQGNKEVHMMIDIETLDTKATALILQVGVVIFNRKKNIETMEMNLGWHQQIVDGRTVSRDTLDWHKKQGRNWKVFFGAIGSIQILNEVMKELQRVYDIKKVWSRGSMDAAVLRDAGCYPFPYWMERDCRTLDEFKKMEKKNSHNALDDCMNQVNHVRSVLWNNAQAVTA